MWYVITYPFPNFNGLTVGTLGMDKLIHPTLHWAGEYLSMLGLKLIRVSKMGSDMILEEHINDNETHFALVFACQVN